MSGFTRIQIRRATAASWTSTNPVLAQGEHGLETDTTKQKVGDGTTAWTSLPYVAAPIGAASGIAPLDSNSLVPLANLPITATPFFLIGSGVPSSPLGMNGDYYQDIGSGNLYGPKAAGAWGSVVATVNYSASPFGVPGQLLARKYYAPTTPSSYTLGTSFVAVDATNLTISFTTKATGAGSTEVKVKVQIGSNAGALYVAVGMIGTGAPAGSYELTNAPGGSGMASTVEFYVTGLTASTTYSWNLGYVSNGTTNSLFAGSASAHTPVDKSIPGIIEIYAGLV